MASQAVRARAAAPLLLRAVPKSPDLETSTSAMFIKASEHADIHKQTHRLRPEVFSACRQTVAPSLPCMKE